WAVRTRPIGPSAVRVESGSVLVAGVAGVDQRAVTEPSNGSHREQLLDEVVGVGTAVYGVEDLAVAEVELVGAAQHGRLLDRSIPQPADHLRAGVRATARADPRAIAHLGDGRAQVRHVWCLVGADVGDDARCLAV